MAQGCRATWCLRLGRGFKVFVSQGGGQIAWKAACVPWEQERGRERTGGRGREGGSSGTLSWFAHTWRAGGHLPPSCCPEGARRWKDRARPASESSRPWRGALVVGVKKDRREMGRNGPFSWNPGPPSPSCTSSLYSYGAANPPRFCHLSWNPDERTAHEVVSSRQWRHRGRQGERPSVRP